MNKTNTTQFTFNPSLGKVAPSDDEVTEGVGCVYIGLSGGVDSSVSALLLQHQGYNVIGVFIKTWQPDYIECTWKEDRLDAMRIAAQLDIAFVTLDLEKEYRANVIDYMLNEYSVGRTPNPDIMCNKEIKFGAFYKYVKSINPNAMIATGHYANVMRVVTEGVNDVPHGIFSLAKAKDTSKDQVYFLSQIDKDILKDIIFPLGNMMKSEVREIAKKNNLYVADKKDSQGICMLGNISMKDFLKKEIKNVNESMLYTIGERLDFNVNEKDNNRKLKIVNQSMEHIDKVGQKPFFVIDKNVKENIIYISNEVNKNINNKQKIFKINNWNYTSNVELKINTLYEGQTRYHGALHTFKVLEINFKYILTIEIQGSDTMMISGQTLVLYDNDIMIGGGIIV